MSDPIHVSPDILSAEFLKIILILALYNVYISCIVSVCQYKQEGIQNVFFMSIF